MTKLNKIKGFKLKLEMRNQGETLIKLNLFKKLRAWRLYVSREISVPPHVICTDQALSEIVKLNSKKKVKSIDDLSKIQGIGRPDLLVDGINGVSMLDIIKNRN